MMNMQNSIDKQNQATKDISEILKEKNKTNKAIMNNMN